MKEALPSSFRLCLVASAKGDPEQETIVNIQEAIALYLEPVKDDWLLDEQTWVQEIDV